MLLKGSFITGLNGATLTETLTIGVRIGHAVCMLTVLSWANTHSHTQLKHQKLRVGSCMEEVLEYSSTIPVQVPTPDTKC